MKLILIIILINYSIAQKGLYLRIFLFNILLNKSLKTISIVNRTIFLNNKVECPIIGLGNNIDDLKVAKQMVIDAIDVGYRHIDTAAFYDNEEAVGEALTQVFKQKKVNRNEVFVTTKIFYARYPPSDRRRETRSAVHLALRRLGLSYIDLMLLHLPSSDPQVNKEIWSGLEDALDSRLVRAIGVSNFNSQQLDELIKTAKVVPQMNQIESNPQKPNNEIIDYCKRHGIQVTAYSPLGSGSLIKHPGIAQIANNHNKSTAQVMIRWQLQRGVVVIPKSTKKERIRDNFNVFDFSLTEDEMKALNSLNSGSNISNSIIINVFMFFNFIIFSRTLF